MAAFNQTSLEIIDFPDLNKIPDGMPWAVDTMSLAHALGIRARTLMYLIIQRANLYRTFTIPKKSGGRRVIHSPQTRLKYVQGKVLDRILNKFDFPEHVSAYVPNKTTRDSAAVHAGKPILIVLDLKDFFTTTRRSWVRHAIQDTLGYSHHVAGLLADLSTVKMEHADGVKYVVPQGAPTSGAICNLVAHHRIDKQIVDICNAQGFAYTRYADDLAFSHTDRLDRKTTNAFIKSVTTIIKKSGYSINRKKLRVARSGRQQRLLGMTINEKPNIIRAHYKRMRSRIHHCKCKGFSVVAKEMNLLNVDALKNQIKGQISYYHMINADKAAKLKASFDEAEALHPKDN